MYIVHTVHVYSINTVEQNEEHSCVNDQGQMTFEIPS